MNKQPLTKKQVEAIQPVWDYDMAWTRFRDGRIVPNTKPRLKRTWSFEGTHSVTLPDGTVENRPGQYVIKLKRGLSWTSNQK